MLLSPYRVLDCTDHRGPLAGMMLAQLGADVVSVEPPEGSSTRRLAPFLGDAPGPERSLWHWAYGRGKRSVALDLGDGGDRDAFDRLAAGADVVLVSGRPGQLPFDPHELSARHPHLVVGVLTAFGLDGPKSGWNDADLVVCAAGCQLAMTGDNDRPPLRTAVPQGFLHGAADLAVGATMALVERSRSGRGQVVDVSAQEAFIEASFAYSLNEAWKAPLIRRSGRGVDVGAFAIRWGYPAVDGEVSITLLFGPAFNEFTPNLFRWIHDEGGCDEATRDKPWEDYGTMLFAGEEPLSELERLGDVIAAFTSRFTRAELVDEARRRRVLLGPVATLGEVLDNDHLAARGFFDCVTQVDGRSYRHPGRFLVASATPLRTLPPGSALGADTDALLAEAPRAPAAAPAPADPTTGGRGDVLDGLKVLDLTWSIAGPYVGRGLADFGATVVKVESRHRVDVTRTVSPLHPGNDQHPLEGSGLFSNSNAGKLGIELDLRVAAARDILWDLIRWADVVVESFSAGAFSRMGFGYERLREVNPDVILLSSCLPGQTGTLELPGYGNLSSAMFGFHFTTRWPDRGAAGPFGAYTDTVSPRFALAGLLAAIDHRRRTGEGQHLDISQAEASLHLLAPALLDVEVNGREFEPLGNADLQLAPHGVYPTAGDDEWVAIVVQSDDEWCRLAAELARPDLADLGAAERIERRDELDAAVAGWTAGLTREAVQDRLQGMGIAAHRVQNSSECLADPQLHHRGHYVEPDHPLLGPLPVEGPRYRLSATPGQVRGHGPTYGQHTFEVLTEILGYDADAVADAAVAEAFG